jgi:transglutaminase-like putative cysteine protease
MLTKEAREIVHGVQPGYAQVEAIRAWIEKNIEYKRGSSDESTSGLDTFKQRAGVCRDFVHVGVTLCRALTIPARMVVGYLHRLQPPMDQHAWFEAFVGGRWYPFDATQKEPRGGRIVLAYGRDAADVANHHAVRADRGDAGSASPPFPEPCAPPLASARGARCACLVPPVCAANSFTRETVLADVATSAWSSRRHTAAEPVRPLGLR